MFAFVKQNIRQRITFYVYNADLEQIRLVDMVPRDDWGGQGCLGCDVGYGKVHRIPQAMQKPKGDHVKHEIFLSNEASAGPLSPLRAKKLPGAIEPDPSLQMESVPDLNN